MLHCQYPVLLAEILGVFAKLRLESCACFHQFVPVGSTLARIRHSSHSLIQPISPKQPSKQSKMPPVEVLDLSLLTRGERMCA